MKMKKAAILLVPALGLGSALLAAAPAMAADSDSWSYQAELGEMNNSNATGTVMITGTGDKATVTMKVSGLAETFDGDPYPHVQHIHIGGQGTCPAPSADKNGDDVVDTVEGQPAYGMIGTTLSTSGATDKSAATDLKVAGQGDSYTYDRTFTMNADTVAALQAGTAVVVVHGLDPSTLSEKAQGEKSNLVPTLPLAATSPALCGALQDTQMGAMPKGGAQTGGGGTSAGANLGLVGIGGGLLLAAGEPSTCGAG
ncbi:hypothetical protein [Microbacterium elymi]|uniref:CHRD domain-containing protein n=1 Tax=Microbacterium elymi TaxID=2909587 RepID=A0ABY5NK85_9MICO|nr:hypothetical protein [Microbacterium elymi]UUT35586.1 hypothetical protein L2X98_19945 [Microbacterium elymi]